jgi:ribosomal protein S18 acetylase RimI-like enzyme
MYRRAVLSDIKAISKIHSIELRTDFLPLLGIPFLEKLYESLISEKDIFIWVVDMAGNVEGVIVGSINFSKNFKDVISQNFLIFIFLLIPAIIKKPQICFKIFETLFYTKRAGKGEAQAELVVIAVSKKLQRKGHGKKLISFLEKDLKKKVREYKVSVNAGNLKANLFYKSLGFKKMYDFLLYGKKINLYKKTLK